MTFENTLLANLVLLQPQQLPGPSSTLQGTQLIGDHQGTISFLTSTLEEIQSLSVETSPAWANQLSPAVSLATNSKVAEACDGRFESLSSQTLRSRSGVSTGGANQNQGKRPLRRVTPSSSE